MSFIRSTTLRASSFARVARPTRAFRAAELQPWQRAVQRRTYASGHGAEGEAKSSDVPWMAAAAIGTTVGLYVVVTQDTDHGDEHHPLGDTHGETRALKTGTGSTIGEENKQNKKEEEDESEEEPQAETKDESEDEPKNESKDESKDEPKEEDADEKKESSKPNKDNSEEKKSQSPDESDKAEPRKEQTKSTNEMSGKQKGVSNGDTHHSIQISKRDDKSKKGEGVAETAKLQGTVSTKRPGAENKEERAKAQEANKD